MARNVADTPRLRLRELSPDDAQFAYELNQDPEVIRYTGDGPFGSIEEAGDFLRAYDHYARYGFGRWGVESKETGELLGWCGLKYTADVNEYDLGFRFFRRNWNKGYATESAMKSLEIGFNQFQMTEILGRVARDNHASRRVLEKVGMTFLRNDVCHDEDAFILSINGDSFRKLQCGL
ncbi:MAG: hypothetical protein RL220_1829 [Bacteroidota bacterium]